MFQDATNIRVMFVKPLAPLGCKCFETSMSIWWLWRCVTLPSPSWHASKCTNPRSGFEFQSCQCIAQVVKPGLRPKCRRRPATKFKACSYCSYTCQAVQSSCWDIWSILRAVLVLHGRIQGILGTCHRATSFLFVHCTWQSWEFLNVFHLLHLSTWCNAKAKHVVGLDKV